MSLVLDVFSFVRFNKSRKVQKLRVGNLATVWMLIQPHQNQEETRALRQLRLPWRRTRSSNMTEAKWITRCPPRPMIAVYGFFWWGTGFLWCLVSLGRRCRVVTSFSHSFPSQLPPPKKRNCQEKHSKWFRSSLYRRWEFRPCCFWLFFASPCIFFPLFLFCYFPAKLGSCPLVVACDPSFAIFPPLTRSFL